MKEIIAKHNFLFRQVREMPDVDGKLWAIAGHTNSGHIGMFCGSCIEDLAEVWPISLNFGDGHAE